jgi:hypothetical protein
MIRRTIRTVVLALVALFAFGVMAQAFDPRDIAAGCFGRDEKRAAEEARDHQETDAGKED